MKKVIREFLFFQHWLYSTKFRPWNICLFRVYIQASEIDLFIPLLIPLLMHVAWCYSVNASSSWHTLLLLQDESFEGNFLAKHPPKTRFIRKLAPVRNNPTYTGVGYFENWSMYCNNVWSSCQFFYLKFFVKENRQFHKQWSWQERAFIMWCCPQHRSSAWNLKTNRKLAWSSCILVLVSSTQTQNKWVTVVC